MGYRVRLLEEEAAAPQRASRQKSRAWRLSHLMPREEEGLARLGQVRLEPYQVESGPSDPERNWVRGYTQEVAFLLCNARVLRSNFVRLCHYLHRLL